MLSKTRAGALAGLTAAISMTATPASAAETELTRQPVGSSIYADFEHSAYDGDFATSEYHRWGRRGWRRGYRHRRGIRGGDVLAGVLILGGIAAIASAANNNERRYRERDYERRTRDWDRDNRRDNRRSGGSTGLDSAVDQCASRIERDVRIDSVDSVDRTADGWRVTGVLFNGSSFTCRIGNDGEIADINYGGFQGSSYEGADTTRARGDDAQWSDASYIAARQRVGTPQPDGEGVKLPAYPGGPVAGDEYPGEIDGDLGG